MLETLPLKSETQTSSFLKFNMNVWTVPTGHNVEAFILCVCSLVLQIAWS